MLYPGMVHSLHGESESGKSLIMQAECVDLINSGQNVLYIDFESDKKSVVERLIVLGADREMISKLLDYRQPEAKPQSSPQEEQSWDSLLSGRYALVVIDGVTQALGIFGFSTSDNDDVTAWITMIPKRIATRTGAAVVVTDHVVKDTTARGRWAIGGQAKMAGLTGASYTLEVIEAIGRGIKGELELRVGKDRPGSVRPQCGPFRKKDRTQEAARVIVDDTREITTVTLLAPQLIESNPDEKVPFRPTWLMESAYQVIELNPGQLTKTQVYDHTGKNKQSVMLAIDLLRTEGYVKAEQNGRRRQVYWPITPYWEKDDPRSENYSPEPRTWTPSITPPDAVPGSGSVKAGTREPVTEPVLGNSGEPVGTWEPEPSQKAQNSPNNNRQLARQAGPADPSATVVTDGEATTSAQKFDAMRERLGVPRTGASANNGQQRQQPNPFDSRFNRSANYRVNTQPSKRRRKAKGTKR
ncbi:MAG: AAA family ATPase [Isosphaeraceae bacterium]